MVSKKEPRASFSGSLPMDLVLLEIVMQRLLSWSFFGIFSVFLSFLFCFFFLQMEHDIMSQYQNMILRLTKIFIYITYYILHSISNNKLIFSH